MIYATWMASPAWLARRRAWRDAWVATHGAGPVCAICGAAWTLERGDLHHRSYDRLGAEADEDLIPLCRTPCHDEVHRILESNPAWLRLGRAYASDVIVARLEQRVREAQGDPR
jgi:predicted HNH restriction endonuclease